MSPKRRFRCLTTALAAASLLSASPPGAGCGGPWYSRQSLAQGGLMLLETPQFFEEIEYALLARDYPVPFRAVHEEFPQQRSRERDTEDFDAAIRTGTIRPPDPKAARAAHLRMREIIDQLSQLTKEELKALPADMLEEPRKAAFPSEFADYHEGLLAYSTGEHAAARAAWERLLKRPEAERQYRSVQAAFMIGVLGVVENWDDTPRWFALARELAQKGLHDEAGLAAASYSRESAWHHQRGDLRAAEESKLRSVSAGYVDTTLRGYGGREAEEETPALLAKMAADPLLRKVQTIKLLADETNSSDLDEAQRARLNAWVHALETAGVREFAGAERVAWMCYARADYAAARRWLARAPQDSTRALWLTGKLAARDGKREEALRAFAAATRLLGREPELDFEFQGDEQAPSKRIAAEHGIAAIGANEFRQALEAFLRGDHWVDAAYVAERLLSLDELKEYVRRRPWKDAWIVYTDDGEVAADDQVKEHQDTVQLRWLLARRLARAGRLEEARPFYPPKWRSPLDHYVQGLARSKDTHRSSETRALALWTAALEARYHGLELLGTATAPDWFVYRGNSATDDPAEVRQGITVVVAGDTGPKTIPLPAVLRASSLENARAEASAATPKNRFHYRYAAAALGWKAAGMLPGNDPKTAAMLNLAGRWLASRDPDAADRFYQALESRCAKTVLGQQAVAQHWFVDTTDPAVPHRPELLPDEEQ